MGLPEGIYTVELREREVLVKPSEVLGTFTVKPAPPTQPVYAFYNYTTKHYFLTASAAERDFVLQGGAGVGWQIVDDGFKVWPAEGSVPAAAQSVCRFYAHSVNSHFYTANSAECEFLKQPTTGWIYEGIAFRALTSTAGACPSGATPVWRMYNNRAAQLDTNHRFVASPDTYRHMIANGWIGEGVEFCSPP